MHPRYVAIDTETTGLNPEADEVIEVAAIAFDLDGIVEEYHSFVRPRRPVPYQVERLTGISASELEGAPRFSAIAQDLREFIGDSPIVGQSVDFDVQMLARGGVQTIGPSYDTFELAQLLLPGLHDYSLRGIAERLEIDFPVRHRARADADAAREVFVALYRRLEELPGWLLHEVERLATAASWSLAPLFRQAASSKPRIEAVAGLGTDVLAAPVEIAKPLTGSGLQGAFVEEHEVLALLARAGELREFFPEFERRPEQEEMASAVSRAFRQGRHLVVEAGTGTGKSLAYLLPAALQALRRRERVVVSTDTIGLQEQLTEKDLPVVQALLDGVEGEPLRVAALKGRRNYLCLQRWTAARHLPPSNREEAILHARLLVWLRTTQTGDRAELNLHSTFDSAWGKLTAENVACLQVACPFVRNGTCFLYRARRRAEAAHVLVVNHALLLSDIATGGHVLPAYNHLVIDEAHNLEDEATSRFAFKATEGDLGEFLDSIGRRNASGGPSTGSGRGIVSSLQDAMRGTGQIIVAAAYIASLGSALTVAANRARSRLGEPFRLLNRVLRDCAPAERENEARLLITRSTRVQPAWSELEIATENLDVALGEVTKLLDDLRALLEGADQGLLDQEALAAEVADLAQMSFAFEEGLRRALLTEDRELICWLERSRNTGEVAVCTAPLAVADLLRRDLFEAKETVVLTSATLSAGQPVGAVEDGPFSMLKSRFDFLRERVGLDDADELLLGSPFDFERSTLIALPADLPEPNDPEFVESISELLIDACRASGGRALVLFTAYGALRGVYEKIKGALEADGILVLAHGTDGSPRQLLSALRENPRTVILGTASFWEGVDVAGDALSLLVIVRLPFAVPTDPIYQARSALYDEPFDEYALPQAVLRFRQGFGRLIRTKTDRGVLIVLDRRIKGRKYGDVFLKALPRCTLSEMRSREVPGAIEAWLG